MHLLYAAFIRHKIKVVKVQLVVLMSEICFRIVLSFSDYNNTMNSMNPLLRRSKANSPACRNIYTAKAQLHKLNIDLLAGTEVWHVTSCVCMIQLLR